MTEFVASNGASISVTSQGHGSIKYVSDDPIGHRGDQVGLAADDVRALREFFQHERDIELGRWRSKRHPNYVVLVDGRNDVCVLDERSAEVELVSRAGQSATEHAEVAREFFAAHPEPKPWHNAKDGEVWVLDFNADCGFRNGDAWYSNSTEFVLLHDSGRVEHNDYRITAGRRIWPEVTNAD